MTHRALLTGSTILLFAVGCSTRPGPGPLAPDYHYQASPRGTDEARHVLVDRPERMYDNVNINPLNPTKLDVLQPEADVQPSVTSVSQTASDAAHQQLENRVMSPSTGPTTAPATVPSATPPRVVTSGTYDVIGGVVVEVNGHPIFAEKVIEPLKRLLAAEARRHDAAGFQVLATKAIKDQVTTMVRNELFVAQAEQVLDKSEQDLAWQMTMMWKQNQINAAGGSIEQAKARATAEGIDFDDMLQDKLRENKVMIYWQKKVIPRIQVTAQNVRDYYQRHFKSDFYDSETIEFRLIKIAVKNAGRDDAMQKINDLKGRVNKGEDFQSLATQFNDDTRLARSGGLEQPIARGAYVNEKVEQAAWNLQPGQVSDVVESASAFYLIKVESRKAEHVRPFEDPVVQAQITEILRKEQLNTLIDKEQLKLLQSHPFYPDPPRYEIAIDMAMAMYPMWVAAK